GLKQFLLLARQPIDARGENALHRGRQPQLRKRLYDFYFAVERKYAFRKKLLYHLLDKEWIALGALDNSPFELAKIGRFSEQRRQHSDGALLVQGGELNL